MKNLQLHQGIEPFSPAWKSRAATRGKIGRTGKTVVMSRFCRIKRGGTSVMAAVVVLSAKRWPWQPCLSIQSSELGNRES